MTQQSYINEYHPDERSEEERNAATQMASNGNEWLAHLRAIKHPLIMGQQSYRAPIKQLGLPTKENAMQDHAYEIRQQYINDYAARVKLAPEDQRALWVAHLREIKHPRIEPLPRREPIPNLAEAVAKLERDRAARETWQEI